MKLTDLPNWKKLTKKEKDRLKKVFAPRIKAKYDMGGEGAVSKKEIKKGAKNV